MSSESENEDFLSADEGDNDTDKGDKDNEKSHTQPSPINEGDIKDRKKNENKMGPQKKNKVKHQKEAEEMKVHSNLKDSYTKEASDICEETEKLSLEENVTSNVETLSLEENVTSNVEKLETLKEERESNILEKNKCQSKDSKQIPEVKGQEDEPNFKELENKSVKDSQSSDKPRKEAKLGMKKPREKLGERLGNKKLGSRVTKPLVGISSDSLASQEENKKESAKTVLSTSCEGSTKPKTDEVKASEEDTETSESASWGSWGDWGMSLASTLSKEVSRGVGNVLETVESSIGAPDPEVLAREAVERDKKALEEQSTEKEQTESTTEQPFSFGLGALGSLVSGVSGALETASNTVLLGGLDTLEKIGRKTMDIIQDGDPGLRRKRTFLTSNKQNLSVVLREARERAIEEEEARRSNFRDPRSEEKKPTSVSINLLWDNTEGPAHLEALSLVAKQCQDKTNELLDEITSVWLSKLQEKITKMKVCSCINEDDKVENIDSAALMDLTRDFPLPIQFNKVITGWPSLQKSLSRLSIEIMGLGNTDLVDIQQELYKEVTLYVANVVGVLHKAAEVSLITPEFDRVHLTQQFQKLCSCISGGLEKCADDICESISKSLSASDPDFNATITNIYLQMAEANLFMETALFDMITIVVYSEVKVHHDHL